MVWNVVRQSIQNAILKKGERKGKIIDCWIGGNTRVPHITGRLDTTSVSKKKGKIELRVITKV